MNYLETFVTQGIENIANTDCLLPEDIEFLQTKQKELQDNFEKKQIFRTETEMKVSVLNDIKFPDNASKYWQAVRELDVMFTNLASDNFAFRKNDVEIKKLQRTIKETTDELDIELFNIELEELLFKKKQIQLNARDRMREIRQWQRIKESLEDGSFDTKSVNTSQLESLTIRYLREVEAARATGATLSSAEARNLLGQAITMLRECETQNILNQVIQKALPSHETLILLGLRPAEEVNRELVECSNTRM